MYVYSVRLSNNTELCYFLIHAFSILASTESLVLTFNCF